MFSLFFILYMRFLTEWNHVIKRPFSRKCLASKSKAKLAWTLPSAARYSKKLNVLQARAKPSSLELCRAQLDIHEINKIQKLRKFLASKSKTKLAWAMPNAARHSLSKKIAKSWTEEACLLCRTQPNLFIKKAHYCSCDVWKDQETHLKVPRKASMKVADKPWA